MNESVKGVKFSNCKECLSAGETKPGGEVEVVAVAMMRREIEDEKKTS
jgi:hypothetical protein